MVGGLAYPGKTFEALVLLFGVYVFVRGSIWLSFGLLAALVGIAQVWLGMRLRGLGSGVRGRSYAAGRGRRNR